MIAFLNYFLAYSASFCCVCIYTTPESAYIPTSGGIYADTGVVYAYSLVPRPPTRPGNEASICSLCSYGMTSSSWYMSKYTIIGRKHFPLQTGIYKTATVCIYPNCSFCVHRKTDILTNKAITISLLYMQHGVIL